MNPQTIPTEDMFLRLFCLIDDLYEELVPEAVKDRPGHDRLCFTDSEVITLSILQEALSNDSETSFHRIVDKDFRPLFPHLIERSRYHRRRKALLAVQLHLLRHLMHRLKLLAAWLIVDSAPIETAAFARSQSAKASIPEAAYGFCAAKKRHFFGFRLHLLISNQGAILDFVLAPADVGERAVAAHLLAGFPDAVALGDNGYSGPWLVQLYARRGGRLLYGSRPSQRPRTKAAARLRRFHRRKRALIETLFSMLSDQFKLETTRARTLLGVKVRLVAKLLAFNLSVVLNQMLGRPRLAIKSLHM
jgi:transposase